MSSLELAKEMEAKHPNLYVLKYRALEPLLIKMRDRTTTHMQFKHYADRLMSLLHAAISCDPTIAVGKILIQRDESSDDKHPVMYYSKLPPSVATFENVLVVDPMLGTGGSITMAIKTLLAAGVDENRITFLNVLSCPEGLAALFSAHPNVKVVTAGVDRGLNEAKYLVPGIGDFGDRYFNTVHSHYP
ncbi:uracil phosphoribosyltransferase [Phytophthora cinnamomi]|uniref:uracil phosphoribosyltransferase n=1 Tax=Phytophthora cinnamomi TaxID=4785 RepID=UPI003559C3F5|nr:uracil phosphoribosyltransferase [Phytophthora cinnamomi]